MSLFSFLKKEVKEKSYEELLQLAEEGNAEAQYLIGDIYNNGTNDIDQDKYKAFEWYKKSANQENNIGQLRLAYMYLAGEGTTKNRMFAHALWLLSGKQGNEHALKNLQQFYKDFPDDDYDSFRIIVLGNYEKIQQLGREEPARYVGDSQHLKERIDFRLVELQAECIPKITRLFELCVRNPKATQKEGEELYTSTIAKVNGIAIFFRQELSDDQVRGLAAEALTGAIREVKNLLGQDKYDVFAEITGLKVL